MQKRKKIHIKNKQEKLIVVSSKFDEETSNFAPIAEDLYNRFKTNESEAKDVNLKVNVLLWIMTAIIIIFFVTFVGLIIDWHKFHGESFVELKNSIESLHEEVNNNQYGLINSRLDILENIVINLSNNNEQSLVTMKSKLDSNSS